LVRQIGATPICSFDPWGYPVLNSAFMITPKENDFSTEALLGILNSKLTKFYWENKFADKRKTFPKIKGTYLEQLRVPSYDSLTISDIVRKIISQKTKSPQKDTSGLENEIDLIVYKLYNLTYEEACIVEGNNEWMSKEAYEKFKIEE
jgi:hypothetical protein